MSWTIYRIDPDGSTVVIGCTDDQAEVGCIIDEDRQHIDWEAEYEVRSELKKRRSNKA